VVDCAQAAEERKSKIPTIHKGARRQALMLLREDRAQDTVFIIVFSPCSVSALRQNSM